MRIFIAALLAWPTAAFAAGLSIPDLGADALSQGAAQVASPDNLSAIYYNPASLALHDGVRAMVDMRAVRHFLRFYRREADGSNEAGWKDVANEGGLTVAPMFGVAWRLQRPNLPKIAFAFGGHPASGYSGYSFPDSHAIRAELPESGSRFNEETEQRAPQRYALIEQDSLSYTLGLSMSVEVTPWLLLGATYQNPIVRMRSRQVVNLSDQAKASESILYDGILEIEAWDRFTPVGVLGATFRLPRGVDLGFSVQLPTSYEADGTMSIKMPALVEDKATLEGNEATLTLKTPLIARLGARLRREAFEAELAFTYDGWSRYDNVVLTPRNVRVVRGEESSDLGAFTLTKNMHDTFSARAGGLFRLGTVSSALKPFTLRAGAVFDPSAVPDERISLDQAHWTRFSLNAGVGVTIGRFDAVVAYAHYVQPDKTVTTSEVMQARTSHSDMATVVGNGIYQSSIDVIAASVSARF